MHKPEAWSVETYIQIGYHVFKRYEPEYVEHFGVNLEKLWHLSITFVKIQQAHVVLLLYVVLLHRLKKSIT